MYFVDCILSLDFHISFVISCGFDFHYNVKYNDLLFLVLYMYRNNQSSAFSFGASKNLIDIYQVLALILKLPLIYSFYLHIYFYLRPKVLWIYSEPLLEF